MRAATAGVHVLCEKPLAVSADECVRTIATCDTHKVRLMVAYRLHFDPISLEAIQLVRSGRIGESRFFTSSFSFHVRSGTRTLSVAKGGEGLRDIRVIEALLESAGTGRAIRIPHLTAELWTAQACSIEPGH
jgi:glucose-fructose oxidoreductase